jgi:hypothetical protein
MHPNLPTLLIGLGWVFVLLGFITKNFARNEKIANLFYGTANGFFLSGILVGILH